MNAAAPSAGARILQALARIEPHERKSVAVAFLLFFCVLCGYFMLRPIRETIGTVLGEDVVADLFGATFLACIAVIPIYGFAVARLPRAIVLGSVYALAARPLLECLTFACAALGQRCLVIGHPPDARFPAGVLAVPYAPYDRVFPRASVVVVHGGAGSSGEALRSGRPVLGVPLAFDQFTLCEWMQRLGVGLRMAMRRRDVVSLASALRRPRPRTATQGARSRARSRAR